MMSVKVPERGSRSYHPKFNNPEADITLVSAEDTAYRVPHFVLRNTCGFFRNQLADYTPTYGQGDGDSDPYPPIEVVEHDTILSRVLSMICGLHIDGWDSIDEVDDALALAQRWDAQGPISFLRGGATSPIFLTAPLRLYAIATRHGWDDEARLASTHTLGFNLYDEECREDLERIPTQHLLPLLRLHRVRRDGFKRLIDGDMYFQAGNAMKYQCLGCGEEVKTHAWRELKMRMYMEIDRRPLGDSLYGLEMEEWPEAVACWEAKCHNCGRLVFDKLVTLRDIKDCLDKLPNHI